MRTKPEPTAFQSAFSSLESARLDGSFPCCLVCFSFLIGCLAWSFAKKFAVLLLLLSASSSQSSNKISLDLLDSFVTRLLSPSITVLSSLNKPPPLLGPVPEQNFSSSNECVDDPVTSQIWDENVGDRYDVFRFCDEIVWRYSQSLRCSELSLLPLTFLVTFSVFSILIVSILRTSSG